MKRAKNLANRTVQAAALLALALLMVVLFRAASGNGGLLAQSGPTQPSSATPPSELPYPQPVTGMPPDQPTPSIIPSGTPDQTATIYPTPTPLPTPTVRPGPTETVIPMPALAKDPSGFIFYTTKEAIPNPDFSEFFTYSYSNFALQVDATGEINPSEDFNSLFGELNSQLGNQISSIYPSPNGKYLMMLAPSESGSIPFIYDFTRGAGTTYFTEYGGGRFFGWHPDGQRFLSWIEGVALWLVDAETLETTSLAVGHQSFMQGAAISPNGQWIAFIAENDGSYALWITSNVGGEDKLLFDSGPQSYLSPTAWSPDSTQITYYGNCTEKEEDIPDKGPLCLYNLVTGERRAFNMPFSGNNPVWSPDGQYIAGTGYSSGKEPCYSADMSVQEALICFYDVRSIYIESVLSGSVTELASGIQPVWSPDGSMLAFLSNKSGSQELWTIKFDGSDLRQLTDDELSKEYFLNWIKEAGKKGVN